MGFPTKVQLIQRKKSEHRCGVAFARRRKGMRGSRMFSAPFCKYSVLRLGDASSLVPRVTKFENHGKDLFHWSEILGRIRVG